MQVVIVVRAFAAHASQVCGDGDVDVDSDGDSDGDGDVLSACLCLRAGFATYTVSVSCTACAIVSHCLLRSVVCLSAYLSLPSATCTFIVA
jgi:hypothetical protein